MKKYSPITNTIKSLIKKYLFHESDSLFDKKMLVLVLTLGVAAALIQFQKSEEAPVVYQEPVSIDTFIPEGQSLVPIQVANFESLDQIIGQYGVVDLLSTPLIPGEKGKRVAYGVKLIRSPKNPRHFSVLIPADKAPQLVGYQGPFTVVVRNPKLVGTQFVKKKAKPRRPVVYETEIL
jgi:hypothetical protein